MVVRPFRIEQDIFEQKNKTRCGFKSGSGA